MYKMFLGDDFKPLIVLKQKKTVFWVLFPALAGGLGYASCY